MTRGRVQRQGARERGRDVEALPVRQLPLTSRTFLGSAALFHASGGLTLAPTSAGSITEKLQHVTPLTTTPAGIVLSGYLIGWGESDAGVAGHDHCGGDRAGGLSLLAKLGVDVTPVQAWINSSVGWINENFDQTQRYLTAALPSATAAGFGSVAGFRRA
jgi:hypothetical protein